MRPLTLILWAAAMLTTSSTLNSLDLSSKNLSSVPSDLQHMVEFLDLSRNHIRHLHSGDFNNTPHLRFLNMSGNTLEKIDAETFLNTPQLEDLDLSHNSLENLTDQRYLLHMENLLVLNLTFNKFFKMTLGSEFSSLVNLKRLALRAKTIDTDDFKNIAKVRLHTLTLCLDDEFSYEVGGLKNVDAQRLQIAFTNNQIAHNLIADALSHFNEVELMNLTGGYGDLTKQLSETEEIHTSHLYLTKSSIKWQDLTHGINVVLDSSIDHLTVSDVFLSKMPRKDTAVTSSKMKSFLARRIVVTESIFSQQAVYNFFVNMPVDSLAIVETPIIHMTCPTSQSYITYLDFSHCALSDKIFSEVKGQETVECEHLGNLKKLTLAGNNLKNLQLLSKRVQYMNSLQHLDLSLNSLTYDSLVECVWPPNITNMNLSSNGLTDAVFNCLPNKTKILDLHNNQISAVPLSILKMDYLLCLNLSTNRLQNLPVCDRFPMLNLLLLRANSIHAPTTDNLDSCPNLKTLDVSHNPFVCTCALKGFRNLGIRSEQQSHTGIHLLNWPSGYYCIYPEALRDFTLKDITLPEITCNVGLLSVAILVPAVIVIIAVVTLCHRWDVPWYIGMIWQWTRAKYRARKRQVRPEDLVGIEFHAFVSYSQHDADWVHNSLIPNLEGATGQLRICYHEMNFVPGKTIIENIMNCVEKSRYSVFVLSSNFIKSEWCHYELYFASHKRSCYGTDVVLVLLEPLPQHSIPSKYYQLKAMMSRHTYLEWPKDRAKQRLFWANLIAALQADLPNVPLTELEE